MQASNSVNETQNLARIQHLAVEAARDRMQKKYADFNETELKVIQAVKTSFASGHLDSSETSRYAVMSIQEGYSVSFVYKNDNFTLNTVKGDKFVLQDKFPPKTV